jgi:predicted transcriptional regulator
MSDIKITINPKYTLNFNNKDYNCNTLKEMSKITNKPISSLYAITKQKDNENEEKIKKIKRVIKHSNKLDEILKLIEK